MDRVAYVQHAGTNLPVPISKNFGKFRHLGLPIGVAGYAGMPIVLFSNRINTDLIEM